MTERYDVVVGRKYTKDGVEKTAWSKIGVAFKTKSGEGISVQLESIPAPADGAYRFMLFPPQPKPGQASPGELDDSVPF